MHLWSSRSSSPFAFINQLLFVCPEALRLVVEAAKPGVSVLSLCEKGDAYIMVETGKVFKKEKEMKKGTQYLHSSNVCVVYLDELRWTD